MVKGNRCLFTLAPMGSGWQYVLMGAIAPPPPPRDFPNYWDDFQIQMPFDSPGRELSEQRKTFDFEGTDDVTGQVKVIFFVFSGLMSLASKISMLSANKINESACIVYLTFLSINASVLRP